MISQPVSSNAASFAIDPKEIESLRQSARQNSPDALKAVAKQFEGLFMNMIMKSMRDATPKDGPMDSEQGKMFTSMLDQQLSQNLAKRGVGLADVMIRQLSNTRGMATPDPTGLAPPGIGAGKAAGSGAGLALDPALPGRQRLSSLAQDMESMQLAALSATGATDMIDTTATTATTATSDIKTGFQDTLQSALASGIPGVIKAALMGVRSSVFGSPAVAQVERARIGQPAHVRAFEDKLAVHAQEAARSTGIPAKFMLGQAALESGWGKREILAADGSSSHNVFGIKAGASWKGKVVETATTEYVNGVPERRIERFRAYDSYGDAFRDYAQTLQKNPRYQAVLANAQDVQGFAQGLQRAGYATDPHYAAKLTRIITHSLSA